MSDRKLNTNDQQIRLEALAQANANATAGTPMDVIVAEAMVAESYIKFGPSEMHKQLRAMRDIMSEADIAAYVGLNEVSATHADHTEEPHPGEVDGEQVNIVSDESILGHIGESPVVEAEELQRLRSEAEADGGSPEEATSEKSDLAALVCDLYSAGEKTSAIAERLNITPDEVRELRRATHPHNTTEATDA